MILTNLCLNPSMETLGATFWNATGGATLAADTTVARVGSTSLKATLGTVAGSGAWYGNSAATPGVTYGFRANARPSAAFAVYARLQFLDSALAQLALVDGTPATPAAGTWGTVSVTATAPAGTVYVRAFVTRQLAGTSGQVINVDAALLATVDRVAFDPALYFDGDTPDTEAVIYSWTGTPNESTSTAEYLPTPAPFALDTPTLLPRSMSTSVAARIVLPSGETIALDLVSGSLSWDETRSPRVEANLTCRVPLDVAQLSRIDPRLGARLQVDAGYVRPGGIVDVHTIADLALRRRQVTRPADLLTLLARSDESLIIDAATTAATGTLTAASTVAGMVSILQSVLPTASPTITAPNAGPALSAEQFDDRWDFLLDLADRVGARVYDDGLRSWRIDGAPVLDKPTATLAVGPNGTVTGTESVFDRDGDGDAGAWANAVLLVHRWTDSGGVDRLISSYRRVTSGPYTAAGNTKAMRVDRTSSISQAGADAAAASLVARTVTRGRSVALEAIAAYWLRPGHTITAKLPTGSAEDVLVSGVTFDLATGLMAVGTRLPDNTGTIGA